MAQTFILIAQQPFDFKDHHYEPGDRLVVDPFESARLQARRLTIIAPPEEQRALGAHPVSRRRGRPRKAVTVTDAPVTESEP